MPKPETQPCSLCLIKAGGTYPEAAERLGDFEDWLMPGLGMPRHTVRVVDARQTADLPEPRECAGVVMTGSHAMITHRLPWMARLSGWIERLVAADVPFLGICFGHQMLAQAMGGRVDYHPGGREIGTVPIGLYPDAAADPLFSAMPSRFAAHAVHAQSVLELPPGATRLAGNAFEPTHAFRIGARAWGIQFHPEFDVERMGVYVDHLTPALREAGRDIGAIRAGLAETPESAGLLARFAHLARTVAKLEASSPSPRLGEPP
jgi:GMP synthase (glutamine-hydrolysing)